MDDDCPECDSPLSVFNVKAGGARFGCGHCGWTDEEGDG